MHGVCDWCDDEIPDDEERVNVYRLPEKAGSRIDRDGTLLATFHEGTCFSEARDYGWG